MRSRETAAEHIRNAQTMLAFSTCEERDAISARLTKALREVEAGNLRNPAGDKFLKRAGMPTGPELAQWISRLGIKATASALRVNRRTLEKWWAEHTTPKNPRQRITSKAQAFIGAKIRRLAREGMPAPRRVAAAYSMTRRRGFKVPKKNPATLKSERAAWIRVKQLATGTGPASISPFQEMASLADAMLTQLRHGYHRNPMLAVLGNPPSQVAGTLSRHTYGGSIKYRHAQDGKDYRHTLGSGAHILLLRDGSVLLKHPTKRLWKDM